MTRWVEVFSLRNGSGELIEGKGLRKVNPNIKKLSHAVGILGMPGMNAYFGILEVARPKRGETILISGAAGAIGSTAGQIAKLLGARVIGLAGSSEKIQMLQHDLGFDLALNYKSSQIAEEILSACPNGPDIYFDNVGGQTSQTVMWTMRHPGRVIECGQISTYNDQDGGWLVNIWPIHMNQLRLESFVGYSYAEFFPAGIAQIAYWIEQGKIKPLETEIVSIAFKQRIIAIPKWQAKSRDAIALFLSRTRINSSHTAQISRSERTVITSLDISERFAAILGVVEAWLKTQLHQLTEHGHGQ
ncbi:MAG: NADP-dependent oxidoreductase [Rhizonema sp. PD38]|nr:NADP-dependent oxidoreductase [Rhizonema sp. PD38]